MVQNSELGNAAAGVDDAVAALFERGLRLLNDGELVEVAVFAGALLRRAEGLLIEAAQAMDERCVGNDDRLDVKYGCRNVVELLERATGVAPGTAKRWSLAGRGITTQESILGVDRPAPLPALRGALLDGHVGLDGLLAIAQPLLEVRDRVSAADLYEADAALAELITDGPAAFTFEQSDGTVRGLPTPADSLRALAIRTACILDQDGAEPTEALARASRSLTLGRLRRGTVPISGNLLPEVAAQLQAIFDAITNPHGKPAGVRFSDGPIDDNEERSPGQLRHDALATALTIAAASRELPTLGGAAPTLVVTVRAEDLMNGTGWAETCGMPVPLPVAHHVSCGGTVQRVILGENGRILEMGTEARVFDAWQRRAIAARDEGCVIPGCTVPPSWCEVHHVVAWARGGRTHVDEGVLLCWYHHRYIEVNGWGIRIVDGIVEIQPPPWLDSGGRWRPAKAPALQVA